MGIQDVFDQTVAQVPEEQREQFIAKVRAAATRAEKIAIAKEFGVNVPEEGAAPAWLVEAKELSDDELEQVADGTGMSWDAECQCN